MPGFESPSSESNRPKNSWESQDGLEITDITTEIDGDVVYWRPQYEDANGDVRLGQPQELEGVVASSGVEAVKKAIERLKRTIGLNAPDADEVMN